MGEAAAESHAPSLWDARIIRRLALVLLVGATLVRAWAILGGRADGSSLASVGAAITGGELGRRVSPLEWLTVAVVSGWDPLAFWPLGVVLIAVWVAYVAAAVWTVTALVGPRPGGLVLLALLCATPMTVPANAAWPDGIAQMTAATGALLVLGGVVRLRAGATLVGGAAVLGGVAVAMAGAAPLPWAPALVVAAWAVALLLAPSRMWVAPKSWERPWPLRVGLVGVVTAIPIVWCAALASWPVSSLPRDLGGLATYVGETVATGVIPGMVGGPVDWTQPWPEALWADPPIWVTILGIQVLVAAVAATVVLAGRGIVAWVIGAAAAAMAIAFTAASSPFNPGLTGRELVGSATAAAFLALPIGIILAAPRRDLPPVLGSPRTRWFVSVIAVDLALAASVLTTVSWSEQRPAYAGQEWLDSARESLALAPRGLALLPQVVPPDVVDPALAPSNRTDVIFAPLDARPPFAAWTSRLQVFDDSGRLVAGRVSGVPLSAPECAGSPVLIDLKPSLPDFAYTLELELSGVPTGGFAVRLGDGVDTVIEGVPGPGTIYAQVAGGGDELQVTARGSGDLCITTVRVGQVAPRTMGAP